MTVFLVPGVFGAGGQILDQNGKPLSGALINTYAAGTTSPVATYTTVNGNVTASNPVATNADGRLPYELWQSQGQALKIVLTDSLANTLGTYDNLQGINDLGVILSTTNTWTAPQTFSSAYIVSLSANSITVTSINASSINASYLSVTNLTVSSLSNFLGLVNWSQAVPIPTISSLSVATATGNFIDLTGTNTVTSLGVVSAGALRLIRMSGVAPILSSASQTVPGSTTITSAPNDMALAVSLGSGNWQWGIYQKADGSPIAAPASGLNKLTSGTVTTAVSTVDIVMTAYTAYKDKLVIFKFNPSSDNAVLSARLSTDGGSTYLSAGNYWYSAVRVDATNGVGANSSNSATSFVFTNSGTSNISNRGIGGTFQLFDMNNSAYLPMVEFKIQSISPVTTILEMASGSGFYNNAQITNAMRFIFSAGNISAGSWELYGYG